MINLAKISFLLLLLSTSAFASFSLPKINWKDLNSDQRVAVLFQLREFMADMDKISPEEVANTQFHIIEEAYAAGFDCFVAGWPSTKNSQGRCESPIQKNSNYKHYLGCREGEMLCNPTVFGDGLCIKFQTSEQKNGAFNQCEKLYAKESRLFSDVIEMSSPKEFDDLVSTVYQTCHVKKDAGSVCQNLKRKLQHFVPDEVPQNYDSAKKLLTSSDPEKILNGAKKLQSEMEQDYNEFKRVCDPDSSEENRLYCKNLSLRVKKSNELIPKLYTAVEAKVNPVDCVNCSHKSQGNVLNSEALPDLSSTKKLTCSEEQKKINRQKCDKDVYCTIGSTVFSTALVIAEALGQKPNSCLSSQNDCVTNLVSALVDSILSMVTGIWDLLGMLAEWTGEKLSQFWDYVRGVEDKTSNAQLLLNKMSDADKKEVKTNPIKWVTILAQNIWEGIKTWMKEDIFCEKWAGVPRASECTQPAVSFDCLSCRTMITGTCSASGVILAEVLPAFFTGGSVNLAAHAGTGVKVFSKAIKASKAYKKVVTAVDKLSDIRAIRLATEGAKATGLVVKTVAKPTYTMVKTGLSKVSSGYKTFVASKGFQATSKVLDKASKYTGIKYVDKVMDGAYDYGYKFVDDVAGQSTKSKQVLTKMDLAQKSLEEARKAVDPINDQIQMAYRKGGEISDLEDEARRLSLQKETLSPETIAQGLQDIELRKAAVTKEIADINEKFVTDLHELYKREGIHSKIVKTPDQTGRLKWGLELDFTQKPSTNTAFEFYKRASNRFGLNKVTVNLEDSASNMALGFFQPSTLRMEVGPNQGVQLLEEFVNSTGRHELRHAMFMAKRSRGDESIFHLSYHASPGGKNLLNNKRMYESYMSAEELYTFSTDLQTLSQMLKGDMVTDLVKRKDLLNQIARKNSSLQIISDTNGELASSMLASIKEIKSGKHGLGRYELVQGKSGMKLQLKDKLDRVSVMEFVSAEEALLFPDAVKSMQQIYNAKNAYLDFTFRTKGVDVNEFMARARAGKLTPEDSKLVNQTMLDFDALSETKVLYKAMDEAMTPILDQAQKKFEKLQVLSANQAESVKNTEALILKYHQSGKAEDLSELRGQLFNIGKNVKEDYKGFAQYIGQTP